MIAMYAFIGAWVAAGLGVFLVAMLRGRKPKTGPESPAARRNRAIVLGAIFLGVGIAVPAASIANSRHSDIVRSEGVKLTENQKHGQLLFGRLCGACHRLYSANAVGRVGPNLDIQLTPAPAADAAEARKNYQGRYEYVYTTIINGIARGNGNMPALVAQGQQAKDISAFVAATAGYKNP